MAAGAYDGRRRTTPGDGHRRPRPPSSTGCGPSPPSTRSSPCPTATSTPTRWTSAGLGDVVTRSLPGHRPDGAPPQDPPGRAGRRRGEPTTRTAAGGAADAAGPRHDARRRRGRRRRRHARPTPSASSRAPTWRGRRAARCAPTPWPRCSAGGVEQVVLGPARPHPRRPRGRRRAGRRARPRTVTTADGGRRRAGRRHRARRRRRHRRAGRRRPAAWPSSATSPSSPCSPASRRPPGSRPQTVLVAAPARRRRRPRGRRRDDGRHRRRCPGCAPSSLAALAADGPPRPAAGCSDPADAVLLDPAGLADVAGRGAARDDLADAVVGDADTALRRLRRRHGPRHARWPGAATRPASGRRAADLRDDHRTDCATG